MTHPALSTQPAPGLHATAARTRHASKRYGTGGAEVVALDDVTVDFERARFTAIMGPSGSGKSTLLHCLAGLDALSSGQAFIGESDPVRPGADHPAPQPDRLRLPVLQPHSDPVRTREHHVARGPGRAPGRPGVVRGRDDVGTVVELRYSGAKLSGDVVEVAAADPRGLDQVLDLDVREGDLQDFTDGTMLTARDEAGARGIDVGDPVTLRFPETGATTMRVVALFGEDTLVGSPYVLTVHDFEANVTSRLDRAVLLTVAADVPTRGAEERLSAALAAYPNVKIADPAEFTQDARQSVDQLLGLVTALLLLSVVIAVLGITNTLVLSVVERQREFGLLRAVGATRRQVAAVVRYEATLMSVLGALTGLGFGVAAGAALSRAMVDQGITTVRVPSGLLVVYLVVAVAVGSLAAVGPARRAGRTDVLTAVTVE